METAVNTAQSDMGRRLFDIEGLLREFNFHYFSEDFCRKRVLETLHPDAARCPQCKNQVAADQLRRFWECKRLKCASCGKFFTALTGTVLSGCHLTFSQLLFLAVFLERDMPLNEIAERVEINVESVRLWKHRIQALKEL
ncbi:MAG: hypothetical protein NTY16_06735 [Deltaproteobacteria bacterium]|nr:hypothetical protein [Deltaproteobacteria bacterium]